MHDVFIGIGSNLGDRETNCESSIQRMEDIGIELCARSSMRETEPWGIQEQPFFINMVIRTKTTLLPRELLKTLKRIEREMGREEGQRWGPRLIDLDILLYDDLVLDEPGLQIPHPHLCKRGFVLKPLAEIAPDVAKRFCP